MMTNIHFWSYITQFSLEWEIFKTKLQRKLKHISFSVFLFPKILRLLHNVEKYRRAGQATDDNMLHALGVLNI